jgi:hypothetical protein
LAILTAAVRAALTFPGGATQTSIAPPQKFEKTFARCFDFADFGFVAKSIASFPEDQCGSDIYIYNIKRQKKQENKSLAFLLVRFLFSLFSSFGNWNQEKKIYQSNA